MTSIHPIAATTPTLVLSCAAFPIREGGLRGGFGIGGSGSVGFVAGGASSSTRWMKRFASSPVLSLVASSTTSAGVPDHRSKIDCGRHGDDHKHNGGGLRTRVEVIDRN